MKRDWNLLYYSTLTIALVVSFVTSTVYGQAFVENQRFVFPTDFLVTSCSGEPIKLVGSFITIVHFTVTDKGRQVDLNHQNFQGVRAVGLDTGQIYQVQGVSNLHDFYVIPGSQFTDIISLHILGQGAGNDLYVYYTVHYTVNSDGEVTAAVDDSRFECK